MFNHISTYIINKLFKSNLSFKYKNQNNYQFELLFLVEVQEQIQQEI